MSREDYYEGTSSLWSEDWFERMFRKGQWASNRNFAGVMEPMWNSYHPYVCNACKRGSWQNLNLLQCTSCRVVKYCCKDHQIKDWPSHKGWCKAFAGATKGESEEGPLDNYAAWYKRQEFTNMKISAKLGDMRHTDNAQIAFTRPHCRRCFRAGRTPEVELVVCQRCCGIAVCKACLGNQEHAWRILHDENQQECDTYVSYLCCSGMIVEQGNPLYASSDTNCTETFQPKDWFEYFARKGNDFDRGLQLPVSLMRQMAPITCYLTDCLTMPLTIQTIVGDLSLLTKTKLCIHILGADVMEQQFMTGIIELARNYSHLKHLDLVYVGPNLSSTKTTMFSDLTMPDEAPVHFHGSIQWIRGLYHEIITSEVPEPNFFVAFNAGISDPSHLVHWRPTLELLRHKSIPFAITGFNFLEVSDDVKKLKALGFQELIARKPNPFRSMRPFLDPGREETDFCFSSKAYAVVVGNSRNEVEVKAEGQV